MENSIFIVLLTMTGLSNWLTWEIYGSVGTHREIIICGEHLFSFMLVDQIKEDSFWYPDWQQKGKRFLKNYKGYNQDFLNTYLNT